ncbi:MAG TPA: hypothetical protein VFJ74_07760 [Gemmatimonadaceae bacterium]|nr:hypothetical protein [Gemmatimonadaceae bacterium]
MVRSKIAKSKATSAAKRAKSRTTSSSSSGGSRRVAPGISRIDQEATRTHGFFVRVGYERTSGGTWRPRHRAFFGDASHGGKTKALKAAKEWLAEVTED